MELILEIQSDAHADLRHLEDLLAGVADGDPEALEHAKAEAEGIGGFVRSLVGLDREAAKRAFGDFLSEANLNAHQIEFLNLIIEKLTEHGAMEVGFLYESPFTDLAPHGPEDLFTASQVAGIVDCLGRLRATTPST